MEKIATPKRYNLKPPVNPSKPKTPSIKCPECKSTNIKVRSRGRYFLKAAVCAAVVLPYWILLLNLKEEDIPEPPGGIMLLVLLILAFPVATYSLYCGIRATFTNKPTFRCKYCKNIFDVQEPIPFFSRVGW